METTPVFSTLSFEGKKVFVLRDDTLPGGTKQRGALPFIREMIHKGKTHFIYASPFAGYAQVALAYVCRKLEVSCTIICERDQRFREDQYHLFSLKAQEFGAKIQMAPSLQGAEERANFLEIKNTDYKIPLGFDCESFREHMNIETKKIFQTMESTAGLVKTLWVPVGSGTLARTLLSAIPSHVKLKCVNVRVLESDDDRISILKNHPQVDFFEAPMTFHTEALDKPSIPSNAYYDAKVWSFFKEYGNHGDFWWNVAK